MCIIGLSVWDKFGENEIEKNFENRILRAKEKSEFPTYQSGTTVGPCGMVVRVSSTLSGTAVRPCGTHVPASLCAELSNFHFL